MFTRKQYLNGEVSHDEYYTEIAKKIGIKPSKEAVKKVKEALERGDEHLNTIPMSFWNGWVIGIWAFNYQLIAEAFRRSGDQPSQAGMVCVLKSICKHYAKNL